MAITTEKKRTIAAETLSRTSTERHERRRQRQSLMVQAQIEREQMGMTQDEYEDWRAMRDGRGYIKPDYEMEPRQTATPLREFSGYADGRSS